MHPLPWAHMNTIQLNTIYNEDCLETMKRMPDNFVDLVLTDPPYSGLNSKSKGSGRYGQDEHHIDFDDMSERAFLLFIKPIFRELYRVTKLGAHMYCFTDWKQLRNMMDLLELTSWKLVNIVCWDKGHFGTGAGYRSQAEYLLVFSKGMPKTFNLRNVGNVIKAKRQNSLHTHQKPEELLNILVDNSTDLNDTVYDPFCGSGSTAKVAKDLGRNYIGSEISKEYCDIAEQRLAQGVLL